MGGERWLPRSLAEGLRLHMPPGQDHRHEEGERWLPRSLAEGLRLRKHAPMYRGGVSSLECDVCGHEAQPCGESSKEEEEEIDVAFFLACETLGDTRWVAKTCW